MNTKKTAGRKKIYKIQPTPILIRVINARDKNKIKKLEKELLDKHKK